jgi:hypothetical protein
MELILNLIENKINSNSTNQKTVKLEKSLKPNSFDKSLKDFHYLK